MDISKHLERAGEAARKKNFDYAITLYNQALAFKPGYREAWLGLLETAAKRFGYKKTSKAQRLIQGFPQMLVMGAGKILKNKEMVIHACQRYLARDPFNDSIGFLLGEMLEDVGHLGAASAVYEFLARHDEKNVTALKKAGFLTYRLKDIPASLEFFEKVLAVSPRDAEAEKMRKNLAAEDTLATGSYSKARSSLDLVVDKEEAARQQKEARIHRDAGELEEDIRALEERIEKNPGDKRAQRDLGDLLVRKKDYAAALEHFRRLLQADSSSFDLRCRVGDVEMLALGEKLGKLEAKRGAGGESPGGEAAAVRRELLEKEIAEYSWRVKEHPTDLDLWYNLGQSVFRAGKVDRAIEAFQHSVKDPRRKVESLVMLGKCFRDKGLFELALKQFETALETAGSGGGRGKEIIYSLGDVCQRMGDEKAALSWFAKIYEIDINYRDVAAKIESLKESRP